MWSQWVCYGRSWRKRGSRHIHVCARVMADLFSGYCSFNVAHVNVHQPRIFHPLSTESLVQPMPPEHDAGDSQLPENRLTIQTALANRYKEVFTECTANTYLSWNKDRNCVDLYWYPSFMLTISKLNLQHVSMGRWQRQPLLIHISREMLHKRICVKKAANQS